MLALAGLATILLVLAAILSKRLSPLVALSTIPVLAALLLGRGGSLGTDMAAGLATVAPMAAMFLFAILFFAIMGEVGLFRPVVAAIVRMSAHHPPRVALGTAVLTMIVHLDGSGAATFLIVVPAMVPVYDRLGLDRRLLACVVAMAAGVTNMLPWGGPTIRAATALDTPLMVLFNPMLPVFATGMATVLACAWWLGRREIGRAAMRVPVGGAVQVHAAPTDAEPEVQLDWRFWINALTVVAVLAAMLADVLPPGAAFLLGTVVALLVNLSSPAAQRAVVERHASEALWMVAILFAAGVFTGILRGTGMLDAMAQGGAALLPPALAAHLPVVLGVASTPLSLLFDPDSFYFGVLPVLGAIGEASGIPAAELGRAAIIGQMTTGFAISPLTPATFLLVGLAGVDLADHQRYTLPYLLLIGAVMTGAAVLFGVIGA